jgi:hypothetical protein
MSIKKVYEVVVSVEVHDPDNASEPNTVGNAVRDALHIAQPQLLLPTATKITRVVVMRSTLVRDALFKQLSGKASCSYFAPSNLAEHDRGANGADVPDYCRNCGCPFMEHNNSVCPA